MIAISSFKNLIKKTVFR